ncbi:MAG: DnaJ domain-containing protein [Chloroflexi bacterium]|nr:DnaJ domain-containing protein [Chloroflexota bacterium]
MADFYSILGVGRDASIKEIKDAYRRLARRYHPDVNPGDKSAEAKFKQINEAYHVLSDPKTRKDYEEFGENWRRAAQFRQAGAGAGRGPGGAEWFEPTGSRSFGGVEDILGRFGFGTPGRAGGFRTGFGEEQPFGFGGPAATRAAQEVLVEINLAEAFSGTTRLISFNREEPCASCGGTGRRGRGVCATCSGRGASARVVRLEVKIPAGIDEEGRVRIRPSEDAEIILAVSVKPDPRFRREGADLHTDVEVPYVDAILGGEVRVPTLTGQIALKIPPGTSSGKTFRIAGRGMPRMGGGDPGSLFARVAVSVPESVTEEERALIQRLRGMRNGTGVR